MTGKNRDLHGNAPDKSELALLLIDVINDLEFPQGEKLLQFALPMARHLAELKRRAVAAGVPVIYVNDNFGRWRSDFRAQVEHCMEQGCRRRPIIELLCPSAEDYFVLKPKNSGFFSTMLEILLRYLGVRRVILTGIATNNCVLFTASDAFMRDLQIVVPRDCVAAVSEQLTDAALAQIQELLDGDVRPSTEISFD
jgi:nicotinamidase-related amidase